MRPLHYEVHTRNVGHGIIIVRLFNPKTPLTHAEMRLLEYQAMCGLSAHKFYRKRLGIEVQYIPQN